MRSLRPSLAIAAFGAVAAAAPAVAAAAPQIQHERAHLVTRSGSLTTERWYDAEDGIMRNVDRDSDGAVVREQRLEIHGAPGQWTYRLRTTCVAEHTYAVSEYTVDSGPLPDLDDSSWVQRLVEQGFLHPAVQRRRHGQTVQMLSGGTPDGAKRLQARLDPVSGRLLATRMRLGADRRRATYDRFQATPDVLAALRAGPPAGSTQVGERDTDVCNPYEALLRRNESSVGTSRK